MYEPGLKGNSFYNSRIIRGLDEFKKIFDVIITNRNSKNLKAASEKVYTRDLFHEN